MPGLLLSTKMWRLVTVAILVASVVAFKSRVVSRRRYFQMAQKAVVPSQAASFVRVSNHTRTNAPAAVFLPGIDGLGQYSQPSLVTLAGEYDLYRFEIQPGDRSTFVQLADTVIKRLESFPAPVLLIGECFGGLLAAFIASRSKRLVSSLVLVNPSTSYDRSLWPQLSPLILNTGPAYYAVGLATLAVTVLEMDQVVRVGRRIKSDIDAARGLPAKVDEFNKLCNIPLDFMALMTPATLEWRLTRWLENGIRIMSSRYRELTTPTLVLIGARDRLLPTATEGFRLERLLRNTFVEVKEFNKKGHLLLDDTVDLALLLNSSRTLGRPKEPLPIDIRLPSEQDIAEADAKLFPRLQGAFSPVFLHRDQDGQLQHGIDGVPLGQQQGRPVLLVGNHQLYGFDALFLVRDFLKKRQTLVRSLAHPVVFWGMSFSFPASQLLGTVDSRSDIEMQTERNLTMSGAHKFGVVEVSPGSIFELMKRNETILLFPGGANEACHGKNEAYTLKWKERVDFVRMAAAFDAIIVPFGAIGIADSVNMILDGEEISKLPILGTNARRFNARIPRARAGVAENFTIPVSTPKLPRRIYFLFDKHFDTRQLESRDKKACQEAYVQIRGRVEHSIATLLKFREDDPYDRFLPRVMYESLSEGKQAPTGPLNFKYLTGSDILE